MNVCVRYDCFYLFANIGNFHCFTADFFAHINEEKYLYGRFFTPAEVFAAGSDKNLFLYKYSQVSV